MKLKKRTLAILTVLLVLIALPCWPVYRQLQQERKDRALIAAIKVRNEGRAFELLEEGADGNAHETDEAPSFRQMLLRFLNRLWQAPVSPVRRPGEENHLSALLLLCDVVDVDSPSGPDPVLVRSLLDHGARINEGDAYGCSPLWYASYYKDSDIVRLLLERGAEPNKADEDGFTPLMRARAAETQLLLDHGAHIDAVDNRGDTALMNAVYPPIDTGDIEQYLRQNHHAS